MLSRSSDKILCVDDEANILNMFRRTLGRQFQLYTAASAQQAMSFLEEHQDIAVIVSDYNMPAVNGIEFLSRARLFSPNSVQILLTGNIDLDVAINAINKTKVFRYLPKPCPNEVLCKVIMDALEQYHLIQDKKRLTQELEQKNSLLAASNTELAKQKYLLEYELEMAKVIFAKISADGQDKPPGLEYIISAKETVGGDFLLTHTTQISNVHYLMLGDLTGHGLQSALAVLLVTESFDALCSAEPEIEQLAQGINDKMCRKLPTGLFCAATLIKFDASKRYLQIWHGGMPDAYLLDQQGHIVKTITSANLPLGVLPQQDFSRSSLRLNADHEQAASLFVYSDGVTEQCNEQDTMFGSTGLLTALQTKPKNAQRVAYVIDSLRQFQSLHVQQDDISLLELQLSRPTTTLEPL
jgi:serine phosphatase RsbU (regulator of sigma subunit)